jgi:hypothetical protein
LQSRARRKFPFLPSSIGPAAHGYPAESRWYFGCESEAAAVVIFQ